MGSCSGAQTAEIETEKILEEGDPVRLTYTTPPLGAAPTALHTGMDLPRYYALHWAGVGFPLAAGLLVFGWRAIGVVASLLVCCWAGVAIWRRIGGRGEQIRYSHIFYLCALLALTLPAHVFAWNLPWMGGSDGIILIIPVAALFLIIFCWLFGGTGSNRVHPVILTIFILTMFFHALLAPRAVLQPGRLFFSDLLDVGPAVGSVWGDPWTHLPANPDHAAIYGPAAPPELIGYTRGTIQPAISSMSLGDTMRDRLPPLEDLIIAGQPAPIGLASAIAIIVGGLLLLYNGVIDYRIPLLIVLGAYAAFVFLPIPVAIGASTVSWRWLAMRDPHIGWEMGLTLANYELLAGPLLLVAFFFATWPACRPMYRRGRVIYAIILGAIAGALQLYLDVGYGAYLAMLAASLLTPFLDKWLRPRALV